MDSADIDSLRNFNHYKREFQVTSTTDEKIISQPKKHCAYHEDICHNTYDCVMLKNEIEAEVKYGKLEHLVKIVRQGNNKSSAQFNLGPPKSKSRF